MIDVYTLYFDGSCWPNPGGNAGAGFVLYFGGTLIDSGHKQVGNGPKMSNNVAEYEALSMGLSSFRKHKSPNFCELHAYGDSEFVIKQMNKERAIKTGLYLPYAKKVLEQLKGINKSNARVVFEWIPRELNEECDILSKKHLEKQ